MFPPKSSRCSRRTAGPLKLKPTARGGFRQFQHLLGCRHLLSHNQNGIKIQTYCAIIACLLISLWTGRQPTKRTPEMLCYLMMGWATAEDVAAHVAKLKHHDEQQAAKKS